MGTVPRRSEWTDHEPPLVQDVNELCAKGIYDLCFIPRIDLVHLTPLIDRLSTLKSGASQYKKYADVFNRAINRIDNTKRRAAALNLLDLDKTVPRRAGRKIRQELAGRHLGVSAGAFRNSTPGKGPTYEPDLVRELASILGQMAGERPPQLTIPLESYDFDGPWVQRQAVERETKEALSGGRVILAGPPGSGKSRLAHEMAARNANGSVAWIRAYDQDLANHDIVRTLAAYDIDITSIGSNAVLHHRFVDLLSSEKAPAYAVLDGVREFAVVRQMLSDDIKSTVIITTESYTLGREFVPVSDMHLTEAHEMIRSHAPRLPDDEIIHLAAAAGRRPGVIKQLCSVVAPAGNEPYFLSVREMWNLLQEWPAVLFDIAETHPERRLTARYKNMVRRLRDSNQTAWRLLAIISASRSPKIQRKLLCDIFSMTLGIKEDRVAKVCFERTVNTLEQMHLVTLQPSYVRVNWTTQLILRQIMESNQSDYNAIYPAARSTHLAAATADGYNELLNDPPSQTESQLLVPYDKIPDELLDAPPGAAVALVTTGHWLAEQRPGLHVWCNTAEHLRFDRYGHPRALFIVKCSTHLANSSTL